MAMYEREALSQRQIAKQLGVSRNTVRRVLEKPGYYLGVEPKRRRDSKKTVMTPAVEQRIKEILEQDRREPRKQRHTAHRIWERLLEEGFICGESTVRRYVGQKKRAGREVFIPLEFSPGEEAQVDWGSCVVEIAGRRVEAQYFIGVMCWSRSSFVRVYHAATQEAFLDGLAGFMEYVGGVPGRIWFDRLASAVKSNVFRGLVEQQQFSSFRTYYGFEAHFCNGGKGNEKGRVENKVGSVRRQLLVPVPVAASLQQINVEMVSRCQGLLGSPVPDGVESVGERLAIERPLLRRLPEERYPCYRNIWTTANKTSLLNVAKNWYSVPAELRGKRLTVHLLPEWVEVFDDHRLVACHERVFGEKHTVCDLDHYLDGLLRKPGALRNARPYLQAELPASLRRLHRGLLERHPENANLEMVKVLLLARSHGVESVGRAAEQAISCGVLNSDAIRQHLERIRVEIPRSTDLQQYQVRRRSATEFNVLVAGGESL
jgi:transposase